MFPRLLFILAVAFSSHGFLYREASQLPSTTYDFVIVGGELLIEDYEPVILILHTFFCKVEQPEMLSPIAWLKIRTFQFLSSKQVARKFCKTSTEVIILISIFPTWSNEGVLDSIIPFFVGNLLGSNPFNWNFSTTPQTGLGGRVLPYPRGHILGGSSSLSTYQLLTTSIIHGPYDLVQTLCFIPVAQQRILTDTPKLQATKDGHGIIFSHTYAW